MRSRSGSAHSRAKLISPQPPEDNDGKPPSKKGKKTGDGQDHDDDDTDAPRPALDLSADDALDAGPFAFKPYRLASLVDPKSLSSLEQMDGVKGLLRGLGTHPKHGLSAAAIKKAADPQSGAGAGESAGQRHDRPPQDPGGQTETEPVPGIVVTGPGSEIDVSSGKQRPAGGESEEEMDEKAYNAPMEERRRVFGTNVLPVRKTKSLLQLMWLALKDKVLVLLSIAAVVSLALGFFQDFGTPRPAGEPPVDWVEGVAIIVAILIVVLVGSINDWQKERQFQALNEKKEERGVKVIRAGDERVVDVHEVVVGDIALLEPGEIIPCDGVYLGGHNVRCDESGATGESDAIRKIDYEEAVRARDGHGEHAGGHSDCFMVSGSKVLEGYGSYVVIAVGPKSFNGRIMMALRGDTEDTPLQLKLNDLAELIAKAGSIAGLALFIALMIRFFVQLGMNDPVRTANQKGIQFVNILIISVTVIVVAVPEGLPLAVTLALAFATKRMTKENLLVRVLGSCETMANASVVCTDKTGTLTQNSMTIVAGTIGIHCKFVRNLPDNRSRTNAEGDQQTQDRQAEDVLQGTSRPTNGKRKHSQDFSIDQSEMNKFLHPALRELFNDAIAINSTAFEDVDPETEELVFVGSKTETALLKFAKELGWADYKKTREAANIVQMLPFSSSRKAMGVVVKLADGRYRVYLKGASEILARKCTSFVSVMRAEEDSESTGVDTREMDDLARDNVSRTIIFYANQMLRAIALCYRDFESWPPAGASYTAEDEVEYEDLAQELTLIAITGIEDPLREGVRDAVADCFKAGVTVKMCTGDNVLTARSIALQCGIFTEGGLIMEGPVFRKLSDHELLEAIPRLQVLARSSPEDKKLLVEKLRELGEIVGVTGDGTNDGPALKTADVGFSMGIAGTEVAKEASDIILMDDNFASIVKAIMWGRCVNDAVRKFLQFQISTNITAVMVTFVTAVASASESSVLSAVQLLWINIIMDTFAALALATDPASPELLDRKPDKKTSPLFSVDMYKQIIGQSVYQIIIILVFHFLGSSILAFDPQYSSTVAQTTVFNIFVFAQIANSVNCRRLDNHLNIFEGITRNYYFIGITLIEIGVQILIVFVGGAAFSVTRIGGAEWGISLALGLVSIPLGALIRYIPNAPVERLLKTLHIMSTPAVLPTTRTDGDWNTAIELVRDNLNTFAHIRGGRMRASSYVDRSRKARPLPETELGLPSIMTMVPTLIASSIGRAPLSPNGLADPAQFDPSKSSAALWEGRIQVHPDTKPDDPTRQRWGNESSPC
ncbi:calcium-translocating P-type ATPase [Fomitopsis serialis]|uniref:calcium-translocating P-type ATPase n=1 Tax=Fomitopsis serialis TaxID=139415 RepID=UPI002007E19B|nr:calcium-translocating P-type ATPase [Neoantrodia serialis]KAH9905078.1 calcium-translocating P-type ATPase [Neoantrodia serialis]